MFLTYAEIKKGLEACEGKKKRNNKAKFKQKQDSIRM